MKKSRVVTEFVLIALVGSVWYIVLTTGLVIRNARQEFRRVTGH